MGLQRILDTSVQAGDLPFVVAMVAGRDGVRFSGAAGEAAPGHPASEGTIFRLFSMSKAVCATAAMILFDRGRLDPDAPVADIVPEFGELRVLEGFDGNEARLRNPVHRATIRQLATHTSGLEYEHWNPEIAAYLSKTGHPSIIQGTRASMMYPMVTEPGTRWGYGPSVDWLGLVVSAIDGRSIDRFCLEEILEPLQMNDTSFEISDDKSERLSAIAIRGEDGAFSPIELSPQPHPEVYCMGHALYGSAPDYVRLLRMFLNRGELDGTRILSASAIDFMLSDQTRGLHFSKMLSCTPVSADFDAFPGTVATHSFGFLRNEEDIREMRSAGSQGWAGVLNSFFWFDPKKDVAAVFMTQSLPFAETRFLRRYAEFERAVYAES